MNLADLKNLSSLRIDEPDLANEAHSIFDGSEYRRSRVSTIDTDVIKASEVTRTWRIPHTHAQLAGYQKKILFRMAASLSGVSRVDVRGTPDLSIASPSSKSGSASLVSFIYQVSISVHAGLEEVHHMPDLSAINLVYLEQSYWLIVDCPGSHKRAIRCSVFDMK